jgi:nucleoside-diphosphate-sugar epimerase
LTETALVTGATGFIGSALCKALVDEGYQVRAMHRATSSLQALADLPVERVVADILIPETLGSAMKGVDWVFHTAAQSAYWRQPELVLQTSVLGTQNVMQAAWQSGVRRFVLTSSIAAMGIPAPGELLTEEHSFNLPPERFRYGYAKRLAEIEALKTARLGERYILGGENLSHRQVFSTLTEIAGRRPPWLKIPSWTIEPAADMIDWLRPVLRLPFNSDQLRMSRHYLFCDLSKSRRELGLPEPRPFHQAAQDAYDWYREQGII